MQANDRSKHAGVDNPEWWGQGSKRQAGPGSSACRVGRQAGSESGQTGVETRGERKERLGKAGAETKNAGRLEQTRRTGTDRQKSQV